VTPESWLRSYSSHKLTKPPLAAAAVLGADSLALMRVLVTIFDSYGWPSYVHVRLREQARTIARESRQESEGEA
jgi:hypothetical protein